MPVQAETKMIAAYIGLGSNLDDPVDQLRRAFSELSMLPGTELDSHSTLYQSSPMAGMDQPDYINAVARVNTRLDAEELLTALQAIESFHGRIRQERWGARTLDLDLLLYGSEVVDIDGLQVPHPGMHERAFVLYPLYEIAPDLDIPGRGALVELMKNCSADGLKRV